jgi:hypothetical protein
MAFVGYKTEAQAAVAQKYFDKSYMDGTCRLAVEVGVMDAPVP